MALSAKHETTIVSLKSPSKTRTKRMLNKINFIGHLCFGIWARVKSQATLGEIIPRECTRPVLELSTESSWKLGWCTTINDAQHYILTMFVVLKIRLSLTSSTFKSTKKGKTINLSAQILVQICLTINNLA